MAQSDWNVAGNNPDTTLHPSLSDNRHRQVMGVHLGQTGLEDCMGVADEHTPEKVKQSPSKSPLPLHTSPHQ